MIPTRRSDGSSYGPGFGRTFMTSGSPFQPTRVSGPSSRQQAPPAQGRGATTVVRPGEPHWYDTRIDRQRSEIMSTLCRCQNPSSHSDAYSLNEENISMDLNGNWISWKQEKNYILDYWAARGKSTCSDQEAFHAMRYVLHPASYREAMEECQDIRRHIRRGGGIVCAFNEGDLQHHTGDGHARNEITESAVRTMVNRDAYILPPARARRNFRRPGSSRR